MAQLDQLGEQRAGFRLACHSENTCEACQESDVATGTAYGRTKRGSRFRQRLLLLQRQPVPGMGNRELSVQLERAQALRDGKVVPPCEVVGPRERSALERGQRVERNGSAKLPHRFFESAHNREEVAVPLMSRGVAWAQADRELEFALCGGPVPVVIH